MDIIVTGSDKSSIEVCAACRWQCPPVHGCQTSAAPSSLSAFNFGSTHGVASFSATQEYGSLEAFLPKVSYLLGSQSFDGATQSEGGFASGRVRTMGLHACRNPNPKP